MSIRKLNRCRVLYLVLVVAVLLRLAAAFYLGNGIEEIRGGAYDQISYDTLAQRVAGGYGFSFAEDWWPNARANQPTAFWSYPYTLFLAGLYAIAGHHPLLPRLIQAIAVGLLMPWLVYRIAQRPFDMRTGLIAAAIIAVYLYFVEYAGALMTESFYIVGILWTMDAGMRVAERLHDGPLDRQNAPTLEPAPIWMALELGLAAAYTLLMRQVIVVFLAVLAVWLAWLAWRYGSMRMLALIGLITAGSAIVLIAPFVLRNYRVFGHLGMPNTNVGINFFWANHPIYGTQFEAVLSPAHGVSYQELIPPELRELSEPALDRALLARGVQFIRDDPRRYFLLSLSRIPIYFQFWPTRASTLLSNVARLLSFGFFLPFMIYGLIIALRETLARQKARPGSFGSNSDLELRIAYLALILLYAAVYTAIHMASWANVRYRLPVDALLIIFAARGIEDLVGRISATRRHELSREQSMPRGAKT
jgi:hypothetical protein